ncbi:MAG: T9SS type A sorting domain-containing protein, partial [Bacteroidetes bacterium]|nr:T9SS type A sorting domain-containing protein [Bacteroidota bacterium]
VDESSLEDMISVYPNPTQGSFVLELGQSDFDGAQLKIINARGELVYQQIIKKATEKISVDISDHPAGIYMLRLQSGDIQIDRKITMIK